MLWVYLFLRAINVPLLHDEIATFFYYVQSNNYLPPSAHWDANNHLLNSMLTNWSYHLFGQSPLALRLPNVLCFVFYFLGAYGTSSRIKHPVLRWGTLTALLMSPYIFEYLGESRGYGLAMSFIMIAIYMLIRLIETQRTKFLILCCLFLLLGTAANLTTLVSSILILGFLGIHTIIVDRKDNFNRLTIKLSTLLIVSTPFYFLVKLSFKLKEMGLLYYGSLDGFRKVTVRTLSERFFGFYGDEMALLLGAISIFILIVFLKTLWNKDQRSISNIKKMFPSYLFLGSIALIFFLAKVVKVNYPEGRAAMYLYIFFITAFAFSFDSLGLNKKLNILGSTLLFFSPLTFIMRINVRNATFSVEERHSQYMFNYIAGQENVAKFPATVGGYVTQQLVWYYMNNTSGGKSGKLHYSHHPNLDCDYQIIATHFFNHPDLYVHYDSIYRDNITRNVLFERKHKLERELLEARSLEGVMDCTDEYFGLGTFEIDSLENHSIYVAVELTLKAIEKPFIAWVSAAMIGENGEDLGAEFIGLDWLRKDWDGSDKNLSQGMLLQNIPEGTKMVNLYLWNIEKSSFSIRNGICYLYLLERDYDFN